MSEERNSTSDPVGDRNEREAAFSEDGVDLTLIRWMLSLSPGERLRALEQNLRSIERLRRASTRA